VYSEVRDLHDGTEGDAPGLDDWQPPAGVTCFMIAGAGRPTLVRVSVSRTRLVTSTDPGGDGTVPLLSATAVNSDATYVARLDHLPSGGERQSSHTSMLANREIQRHVAALLATCLPLPSPSRFIDGGGFSPRE
jgi:hypothetical protein